jgi:hypothetical protein
MEKGLDSMSILGKAELIFNLLVSFFSSVVLINGIFELFESNPGVLLVTSSSNVAVAESLSLNHAMDS